MMRVGVTAVGDGWSAHCPVCGWDGTVYPRHNKAIADRDADGHLCPRLNASAMSGEQLRAECERRGMWSDTAALARAINADTVAERDEWKRRAEEAEAENVEIARQHMLWLENGASMMTPTVGRVLRESGPGIAAARPDNSIAHLDEDLLADDA